MTHEQFITQETAKLAKQAGFDWEVQTYYNVPENGDISFRADWQIADNHNAVIGRVSAPTQSVLQRWLREVKNIQLWGEFHKQRSNGKDGWIACYGFYSGTIVEIDYTSICSTYEAAIEAGLQKCLTLLIEKQ